MNNYRKLFFLIIILALFALCALYFTQNKTEVTQDKTYFSADMKNTQKIGKFGMLSKELNSKELLEGIICVNSAAEVSKVDLFMPEMGHGSSPPALAKTDAIPSSLNIAQEQKSDFGCFKISKMEMFMPGRWQVRVFYKTGDFGAFDLNLLK